ncbi:MAG: DUF2807 domain-containing protein [Cyclobacteriaceae bacterium]|nr:DUF2807 domain-containing protein [Cyclobacteriaceae bacterium]
MKIFVTLFSSLFILSSCEYSDVKHRGNGNFETQIVKTEDFSKLKIEGGYEITLEAGNEPQVIVHADENLIEYIYAEVRGSWLVIGNEESIHSPDGIAITVVYNELSKIEIEGACAIKTTETLISDDFGIDMGGAGAIDMDLEVDDLLINISGAGAVKLAGEARFMEVNLSGAGGLSAYDLIVERCKLNISGVGGAEVYVEEELDASVSGLGGISYRGDPHVNRSEISGIGKISRAD